MIPIDRKDLQPGDLLFFGDRPDDITHTGMFIGNGQLIHTTPRTTSGVQISVVFTTSLDQARPVAAKQTHGDSPRSLRSCRVRRVPFASKALPPAGIVNCAHPSDATNVNVELKRLNLQHTWTTTMSSSSYRETVHLRYSRRPHRLRRRRPHHSLQGISRRSQASH